MSVQANGLILREFNKWNRIVIVGVGILSILGFAVTNESFNSMKTLSWKPGATVECSSVECVVSVVEAAKTDGQRIKVIGSGWSWSFPIASDNDTYILLTGNMADASLANVTDGARPTVTVSAGVRAFDLYMILQATAFDIEAKGACLIAKESQTVGGLLSTNVHHSGTKSFYDVAEWVEVVTADGLVRTFPNETLYRLTIGGGGRTGVIVSASFNLAPRATYESVDVPNPEDDSFSSFLQGFADLTSGYEPNELIFIGTKMPGLPGIFGSGYTARRRMSEPSSNPVVLPPDYGELSLLGNAYLAVDPWLDAILPPVFYDLISLLMLSAILFGKQPDFSGKIGVDLDVACSYSNLPNPKHQEMEFFVPVALAGQVGAYIDKRMNDGYYRFLQKHTVWALRSVYGVESLTAANGVLSDGSKSDFICVNIDAFQVSQHSTVNAELNGLMLDLSAEFPLQLRTHPGKYNPPLDPDPESQDVKNMIAALDPLGIFARDSYDPAYLTTQPTPRQ